MAAPQDTRHQRQQLDQPRLGVVRGAWFDKLTMRVVVAGKPAPRIVDPFRSTLKQHPRPSW